MTDIDPITLYRTTVSPDWVDQNGHMNVAYYAQTFDRALEAFFELVGLGRTYAAATHCAMFVVETHFTYQREVVAGDPLIVRLQLLDRDRKRLHCFLELYHEQAQFLAATSEQIAVHVSLDSRKSLSMPSLATARLTEILAAHSQIARPKEVGHKIGMRRRKPFIATAS